ncbi:MAG: hypothetical protein KC613_00485 [Myxococcales bacterium]|nr:hypothetical protein [Myxococcales bacterium]MCB9526224.1 hypothetical protein [Myxococcales bacterium]
MRALIPCLLLSLLVAPAAAQRNAFQAEGEVGRLLQDARSYYDNLELEQTEEALARAIGLIQQYRLSGRVAADVYMQRGILYHVRDQDERATLADFTEALSHDPNAQLDPLVSTPSLQRLFDDARGRARPRQEPTPRRDPEPYRAPDPEPDPGYGRDPGYGAAINHQPPRAARGGEPVDLAVDISDPQVNRNVFRVWAYFRSARAATVQKREMRPQGPSLFTTRIPGRFVAGRQLTYYIAMEDRTGRVIASVRSAKDPIMVPVNGGALAGLDEIPSGDSLTGDAGGGWGGDDEGGYSRVTMSLSLGTGGGFITERARPVTLEDKRISPGFALAPFHTLVELDFWPHERFAISAFARVQIIEFAHLEGGRLKFRAVDTESHDLILRGGGGFGRTRHLVDLGVGLDTTLEGPYMYTLGLTYEFKISRRFQFLVTPDFLHMIGDSPSTHFDLNLGIQVGF